jgi:hypothetical protein
MIPALASIGGAYQDAVVDTGHQTQFLFFVAFLVSFGFIRTSAHMIRAQVSWWPGNVQVGGTHIHHLVWGILLLLIFGWVGVALHPGDPWSDIAAVFFGIGTGLTLDEFALWLNLKDVYWSEQGRRSIDAVLIAAGFTGILLVGYRGWIDAATDIEDAVFAVAGIAGAFGMLMAFVNAAKEKFGMAIISILFPLAGAPGAFRLAKPHSVWAKLFYRDGQLRRSKERFAGSRGEPFWKRGGELVGRLGLGSARRAGQN